MIGGLPGDAIHDVLEELLQYEAKEFIKHAVLYERYSTDTVHPQQFLDRLSYYRPVFQFF